MTNQDKIMADIQLIQRVVLDDHQAFRSLVEKHQETAFRFAFRLVYATQDAQDLVQDSFIRIWGYRHKIKPDAKFTTLLYTIITNRWIDLDRRQRKRAFGSNVDELSGEMLDPNARVEEDAINQDLASRIRILSQLLPSKQRLVFTLRDLEELSIDEVISITGISRASVKSNLSIARQKLRGKLRQISGVPG